MNFKYTTILINFFLLVFSFKVMSDNEGTKKIGNYEKWSVYSKTKSLCYMIAQPENSEGEYTLRGHVRIVVYRNNLENQNKNAVGIDFGYSFNENSEAFIEIDSKNKFKLNTFGQTAWTASNTRKDKKIIEAMIKGDELTAFGQSRRGTKTKDTYSLNGFAKAFNKINDYCS